MLQRPGLPILQHLMTCRLCWRITLVVFGLILAVESAILVPSALRFQQTALDRLAYAAQLTVEPVLMLGHGVNSRGLLTRDLAPLIDMYGIKGIGIYTSSGAWVTTVGAKPSGFPGNPSALSHLAAQVSSGYNITGLEIAWRSDAPGNPVAVVHIDASAVPGELAAYLLRIGGLVVLIVLVVTAGTMLVLYRWVLRALLQLRDSALAAGTAPHRATDFLLPMTRRDELGDLIAAHNAMLERVTESKQRDREVAEERTRFLTRHDPLTRLPNRMALIEYVDGLPGLAGLHGESANKVSLLLVEIAQFSVLSASIGAAGCDDLLGQVSARLHRFAPQEFIAHFGEARFAVINNTLACDVEGISQLAEMLLRELGEQSEQGGAYIVGDGKSVSLVLRIGIAR